MRVSLTAFCGLFLSATMATAATPQIRGDYLEARTADVFTGPCFSNAEVFITGHQAVLAWKVNAGTWDGVDISGLTVAAAIRGTTTFSEDKPSQASSVLIVDETANAAQRDALVSMAKHLAGDRLSNVVAVKATAISMLVENHESSLADANDAPKGHAMIPHAPPAQFWAAGLAQILTRTLDDTDPKSGNEVVAYQPLSKGVDVLPAFTLGNVFKGSGLNTTWDDHNSRGAFVGRFAL
jgi:hypothetical protein